MTARQSSFWSTTSGVVTGVAGTLTGVVGIATSAIQLGWLGGDDKQTSDTTSTSAPAAGDGAGTTPEGRSATTGRPSRGATAPADAEPEYTVAPSDVRFSAIGGRTAHGDGAQQGHRGELDVADVAVEGGNAVASTSPRRRAPTPSSTRPGPARSTAFHASGGGRAEATLVIAVDGAPAQEVALSGVALL